MLWKYLFIQVIIVYFAVNKRKKKVIFLFFYANIEKKICFAEYFSKIVIIIIAIK